ncbi:MAG: FGGY-family carbohydrate kinase [Anaerolineae bacterium]
MGHGGCRSSTRRGRRRVPAVSRRGAPICRIAKARGAFLGLLRPHSFAVGGRAVMEGVAMSVRHVLETAGVEYGADLPLRIAGGSARSAAWNQIRADVTGLNVEIVEQGGAVTLGGDAGGAPASVISPI